MDTGIVVSGIGRVRAFHSPEYVGGVRGGAAFANAGRSTPAAANSFDQSTLPAGLVAATSSCGGAASKRSRRPFVSRMVIVMPCNCSGGSLGLTGELLPMGSSGRELVRYQNRPAARRPTGSSAHRAT